MSKQFFAVILIAVAVLGGVFWWSGKNNPNKANTNSQATASNHVQGAGSSGVVLIEYGDFQCPACLQYYPLVKQVKEFYGDKITFQFRNFPLVQIHPNAMAAHRAAEAAGLQGKFFEMHDLLYDRQQVWSTAQNPSAVLEGYATELGLDTAKYKTDLSSKAVIDTINADMREGQKAGANSTPTFVLDGKKIDNNPRSVEDFIKLIDEAIAAKKQ